MLYNNIGRLGNAPRRAYSIMRREKAQALIILPSAQVTIPQREVIMQLARRERLPTLVGIMQYTFDGALFQNAPNHTDYPERVAAYLDRILKGAKPRPRRRSASPSLAPSSCAPAKCSSSARPEGAARIPR